MKKVISILIIMVTLIVSGCANKQPIKSSYTYRGENQLWSAEYKINFTGNPTQIGGNTYYKGSKSTLTVTYKKNQSDLSTVKNIYIYYNNKIDEGSLSQENNKIQPLGKVYTLRSSSSVGSSDLGGTPGNPGKVTTVTIELDDKKQTIELKNVQ